MPFLTKSTPPAVFLTITKLLAAMAAIACTALFIVADRFGDDPELIARVRHWLAMSAAAAFFIGILAYIGRRWLDA